MRAVPAPRPGLLWWRWRAEIVRAAGRSVAFAWSGCQNAAMGLTGMPVRARMRGGATVSGEL
ncbi:hypothetical protein GCM10009834_36050 [Streptomonospora arabica]